MRLKSIWISNYKNLRDFRLDFDGESFLDIFVGKNGTGKSNFFEALVEVFRHIFDSGSKLDEIDFDYEVAYEIDSTNTVIALRDGAFTINGDERKTVGKTPIPDHVLIYYSGHNDTIRDTVDRYARTFAQRSQNWEHDEARKFINIGPDYKELLLSVMLMQPAGCLARQYICDKLMIELAGTEARLTLSPPSFKHVTVDVADAETFLWGATGVARTFVEQLLTCIKGDYSFGSIYDREEDEYSIPIDLELFARNFKSTTSSEIFRSFDNLKTLGMLKELFLPLKMMDGTIGKAGGFSDGQFQSVYIFAISELFKDRNCITLLDEPDSFLHPEWQFGFLKQVSDVADTKAAQTNHVLLSSHSASTISRSDSPEIRMFDFGEGGITVKSNDKSSIVKSLSAGLMTFSEKEAQLSIHQILKNSDRPILFTEGITDEFILDTAWGKLHPDRERSFDIQGTFGCSFLGALLREGAIFVEYPNRCFFGIFDFDEAYNNWNARKPQFVQEDITRGLVHKKPEVDGYFMLLPVPDDLSVRSQAVDPVTGEHFKASAQLPIELLFHDVPGLEDHFGDDRSKPGNIRKLVGSKTAFANDVVPNVDAAHFECFRPIFDFIEATV